MLRYIINPDIQFSFHVSHNPYINVVNNGYEIGTNVQLLQKQLNDNEYTPGSEVIDWYLFRQHKSVLIDYYGNFYGCTIKTDSYVELSLLKLDENIKQKILQGQLAD